MKNEIFIGIKIKLFLGFAHKKELNKDEARSFTFQVYSVILFLFSCHLFRCKLFDNPEADLATYAQFPAGNRAFQEVLPYRGADDQGGVAIRASHCACGDVGFEGGKVRADFAAGADSIFSSSACGPGVSY